MTTLHELYRPNRFAKKLLIGGPRMVQLPVMVAPIDPASRKPIGAEKELCSLDLFKSVKLVQQRSGDWTDGDGHYFTVRFLA